MASMAIFVGGMILGGALLAWLDEMLRDGAPRRR